MTLRSAEEPQGFIYMLISTLEEPSENAESLSPTEGKRELRDRRRL